jgi:hypothetical protein
MGGLLPTKQILLTINQQQMCNITNYLVVDVENNDEILETADACEAIEQCLTSIGESVKAELFFVQNDEWFGWVNEYGFIGPKPKRPPTR